MRLTDTHPALSFLFAVACAGVAASCTKTSLTGPDKSVTKCQVSVAGPQAAVAAAGGNGSLAVDAAPECQWTAASGATWITNVAPLSGQGPAQIQFTVGANPANSTRQGDIMVNGAAARVSQEPAPCTFDVSPRTLTIGAAAGAGSVAVATPIGCTWNASADASWLSLSSPAQSSGPGSATFNAQQNTVATVRIGSLTIAGLAVVVTQQAPGCTYTLAPLTQNIVVGGGPGNVAVTAGAGCAWTATTDVPWITFNGSATGSGAGSVNFTAATNTGSVRTGHVNIAGAVATVTQDGTSSCTFSINPSSQSLGDAGGNGSTNVTATAGCSWSATSNAPSFITITSGSSGTGNGSVSYSVAANTGGARNGTLTIAGQTFTVNQSAAGCNFTVAPLTQQAPKTAGAVTAIDVTTASHCTWTAAVDQTTPFVSIASNGGTGNGSVGVTLQANTGAPRTGKLTIAGKAVTIEQASGCSYTVLPTTLNATALGAIGRQVDITTVSGCGWTAVSNDSWIHVPAASASGSGSGTALVNIDANIGGGRSGTLLIAGTTVNVTQDSVLCTYDIDRTGDTVPSAAGTGTAVVLTTNLSSCQWNATSSDPTWLHVSAGSASGNGSANIAWTFDANTGPQRSATLTIANKVFTVTQNAAPCSFTIAPTSTTATALGGPASFNVTANLPTCQWTATVDPAGTWVTPPQISGTGNGPANFTVDQNSTGAPRSTTITIPGAQSAFTVNQEQ